MLPHPWSGERDVLLLKLKTLEPFVQCLEAKLNALEMDLLKARALHPDDPMAQTLFLSRREIRPGEGVPSHSLIDDDLERAAQSLGNDFVEKKKQVNDDFRGLALVCMELNREGADLERLGPLVIQFCQAAATLIRIELQPALHLRGQLFGQLELAALVPPASGLGVPGSEAPNRFQRKSKNWNVQYGAASFTVRNGPGVTYIHHLLERPGRDIPVAELSAVWDRVNQTHNHPSGCEQESRRNCNDDPLLDEVARRECEEELDRIDAEMEEAEKNSDTVLLGNLRGARQQLAFEYAKAMKPGGKLVLLKDRHRKLTDRVTKAIHRIIETIREEAPALGAHLDLCISTGVNCKYTPRDSTPWET